ncbi:hypothetical protein ACFX10_007648 [Malus domestica]
MGPQRKMRIYVGYDSPSIVHYLESLTRDLFTVRFADCHFDETVFTSYREDKHANFPVECRVSSWYAPIMSYLDPRIAQSETKMRRIIDFQSIAQSMPDDFDDLAKVIRSHISVANTPAMIDVPYVCQQPAWEGRTVPEGGEVAPSMRQGTLAASQSSALTLKHGRPLSSNDSQPQKRKMASTSDPSLNSTIAHSSVLTHEVILNYCDASDETCWPSENRKISVHYTVLDVVWNRNEMIVDDAFSYSVAIDIMLGDDIEPRSVDECRRRTDWSNWKQAIQVELDSLAKRKVFGPIVPIPLGLKPVGYKWVFVRKRNEKNEIVRYKARLVA